MWAVQPQLLYTKLIGKEECKVDHERLVRLIVRKFDQTGLDEEDLIQEGMIALLKAENTYDPSKGAKFETYANIVIQNRLIDYLRKNKMNGKRTEENQEPEQIIYLNWEPGTPVKNDEEIADMREIVEQVLAECHEIERAIYHAFFQGYSYQEICNIFNIDKKKVDNTIQKIKKRVKLLYEDWNLLAQKSSR